MSDIVWAVDPSRDRLKDLDTDACGGSRAMS